MGKRADQRRTAQSTTGDAPPESPEFPDGKWRQQLQRVMLRWFDAHARDLPWRRDRDPYAVWVSEVMLQQTQVATVRPYFERFLSRYPTIADLAAADEHELLRLWEGLGYYRRARQLLAAARVLHEQHQGVFPSELSDVLALPGIGRYTAGAILSIAMEQPQPILEGNTIRVYSRLLGYRQDPRTAAGQRRLWNFAAQIVPNKRPGTFNQAMMELGSEICRPRSPDCERCPAAQLCAARAHGWQADIPAAGRKLQYEDAHETAVVVWRKQHVLLRRCGPDERWAGLWDFPRFPLPQADNTPDQIAAALQQLVAVRATVGPQLTEIKHAVTRFRITLRCFRATYKAGQLPDQENFRWVTPAEITNYPLSVTGRKLTRWVESDV